jgi:hypothetical protein
MNDVDVLLKHRLREEAEAAVVASEPPVARVLPKSEREVSKTVQQPSTHSPHVVDELVPQDEGAGANFTDKVALVVLELHVGLEGLGIAELEPALRAHEALLEVRELDVNAQVERLTELLPTEPADARLLPAG